MNELLDIKKEVEARLEAATKDEKEYATDPAFKPLKDVAYGRRLALETILLSIETRIKLSNN